MRTIIFALLLAISHLATAQTPAKPLELADGAPERYVVVPGDTLWGIAAKFLKDPYRWGELWQLNRDEVKNPQRIAPGQVIVLDKSGTAPRAMLETVRVRPHEYVEPLKKQISSIPAQLIEPFLTEPLVVEVDSLDNAARIIAIQDNRVVGGAGDRVYAANVAQNDKLWQVFRLGAALTDPDAKEKDKAVLGAEARYLGTAQLLREGEPAEFMLRTTKQEITSGDHLLPAPKPDIISYVPRAPEKTITGRVLSVSGGVNFAGQLAVVSLSRGKIDGVEPGHVFQVDIAGQEIVDRYKGERKVYQLPDRKNGLIFIFRVFNKVSYGLVMEAQKPMTVGDRFHTP